MKVILTENLTLGEHTLLSTVYDKIYLSCAKNLFKNRTEQV